MLTTNKRKKTAPGNQAGNQKGFTLIEILIVVILLGILATIIIPQVSVSTDDAKMNTLSSNLANLRSAIEIYYYQHKSAYPGNLPASPPAGIDTTAKAFVAQLTRYTDEDGNIANTKDGTYKFGPYVKGTGLPANPYNNKTDVLLDTATTDITKKELADGEDAGYKFYKSTGVLMAADGDHNDL